MSVYVVTGQRRYRDHPPGARFEADLEPDAEQRAIAIGAITLLERRTISILDGSYRPPRGWLIVNEGRQ